MVTTDVVDFGLLHEGPDVGRFQVRDFVVVCGREMRAHAAVLAGDDDAAAAGGGGLRGEVFGA